MMAIKIYLILEGMNRCQGKLGISVDDLINHTQVPVEWNDKGVVMEICSQRIRIGIEY